MALDVPVSLTPSKIATFKDCGLAFRFAAIDRLPEPPSVPATRGTLVHAALERLFGLPADGRTLDAALACLSQASAALQDDPEYTGLNLDDDQAATFLDEARVLVQRYFQLEDPTTITPIGLELKLEVEVGLATAAGSGSTVTLRGIIDRLELDEDGGLVVTDYKTGKPPGPRQEQQRLGGVHFYAFLCEQLFGQRPSRVQLLYLGGGDPLSISVTPTEQSTRGLSRRVTAIWSAIERACEQDSFRPQVTALCSWCSFKAYCPAFGGDPDLARQELLATAPAA
jgi:putative RecB family exonuclease